MVHVPFNLEVISVSVNDTTLAYTDLTINYLIGSIITMSTHVRYTPLRLALYLCWHSQLVIFLVSRAHRS